MFNSKKVKFNKSEKKNLEKLVGKTTLKEQDLTKIVGGKAFRRYMTRN